MSSKPNKPAPNSAAALLAAQRFDDALRHASVDEKSVLKRIEAQRERLAARKIAFAQARTLEQQRGERVEPDAPFPARLLSFARLHPVAIAAVAGLALAAGPAKLFRFAGVVLPIAIKLMNMRR